MAIEGLLKMLTLRAFRSIGRKCAAAQNGFRSDCSRAGQTKTEENSEEMEKIEAASVSFLFAFG
jgi:hypothetical protein